MADSAKEKAEKLAAAKKKIEALKKQKAKKEASKKKETSETAAAESSKSEEIPIAESENVGVPNDEPTPPEAETTETKEEEKDMADAPTQPPLQRIPSDSLQSRMRSSFRQGAGAGSLQSPSGSIAPGFGPDSDSASAIYLKQAARIEELEKENKRLAKDAADGEKRYKKAEEELELIRETEAEMATPSQRGSNDEEIEKLKSEIAALQRQNTQLQAKSRQGSSPSMSIPPSADLAAELASKSATIESMELEISNLRAQILRITNGSSASQEQITALEENLARSQKAAELAQRELGDIKKNLERTTEKAVKEGSERISAETKLRTLERESEASKAEITSANQKVETLEKKIQTLTSLHKEHDTRSQNQRKEKEKIEKEAAEMRSKLATLENENQRLRDERDRIKKKQAEGIDDEGIDELEDEERLRLEKKVRDLEAEVFELRRGVWKEKRHGSGHLDGYMDDDGGGGIASPGGFSNVDLGGNGFSYPSNRRRSTNAGKSVGQFISSGFSAFAGGIAGTGGGEEEYLDDDTDFDEEAFRKAQEEEMKKRIERVKEVKRKLREWSGWRLDLVEERRGGGEGAGEIFEI